MTSSLARISIITILYVFQLQLEKEDQLRDSSINDTVNGKYDNN